MKSCYWKLLGVALFTVSCTHMNESTQRIGRSENVRLAQAQMQAVAGSTVTGTINFEQMPNSMIVMLHLEGLKPKSTYQIYVHDGGSCRSAQSAKGISILEFRTNKQGVAENTFKTEQFSVSGQKPLLGNSILVVSTPSSSKNQNVSQLACGQAEPLMSGSSSQ